MSPMSTASEETLEKRVLQSSAEIISGASRLAASWCAGSQMSLAFERAGPGVQSSLSRDQRGHAASICSRTPGNEVQLSGTLKTDASDRNRDTISCSMYRRIARAASSWPFPRTMERFNV